VKPTQETAIRFLGGTSARPLEVLHLGFTLPQVRPGSSTSTACFIYLALIIKAPTKPKGEAMIHSVAMGWIHLVFVLVVLNIHEICLKLKSEFRLIGKFPTSTSPSIWISTFRAFDMRSEQMYP
jgi:hypothetical protein